MVLRADAQRNLERVLDAATEVFAASGPDVSVHEIAQRAGVGHATVFRRFPTKDSLMSAVVERRVADLQALAEDALASDDPGGAFFDFAWRVAELQAQSRGLSDCLVQCSEVPGRTQLDDLVEEIVARAQRAGVIRGDVSPRDVPTLVRAALQSAPAEQWRAYVEVVLDGLRAR
jgi:AcrR family transcriptional regulator